MENKLLTKKMRIPEDKKGLIIGKQFRGLNYIANVTQANVFRHRGDNEIYVEGTVAQIKQAEKLIQEKLKSTGNETATVIKVPRAFKRAIIGRRGGNIQLVQTKTATEIDIQDIDDQFTKITIVGDPEKCENARGFIEEIIKGGNETVFKVAQVFIGAIIGRHGTNLNRLKSKTDTDIYIEDDADDQFKQITIVGDPEKCKKARAFIQEIILSCSDNAAREELGGGRDFACFNQDYLDTEFRLVKCDPPKKFYIHGTDLHEIKILNTAAKSNKKIQGKDVALSVMEKELLPILTNISNQKEEKKLLVDLWCHFGKTFFHNVKAEDHDDGGTLTMEKINELLGNNEQGFQKDPDFRKDCWKTTFRVGVGDKKVSKENIEKCLNLSLERRYWRYDYAFATPSGRNVRFKSWESLGSDKPPPEVKNLLTPFEVKGQEKALLSWLCYPSNTLVKCDLLVPSSEYDCRLKLRTGPKFVGSKSEEDKEEDRILSDYLSHCTLDNHQLSLPAKESLRKGFDCLFYRATQEDIYSYDAEDDEEESFTIHFLYEEGWETDTSEKIGLVKQKQTGIRVVMDSWSDALLFGNWEPQKIVDSLPVYMEFVETLQKNLFR